MKAAPEAQALLLDLQALDTKIAQLGHRAKNLPELATLIDLDAQADNLRLLASDQRGAREDVQLELKRLESDVAVVEARIARDADRLATSSSVKDVAALEQELAALKKRQYDLEEIELSVMERLEEAEGQLAVTSAALQSIDEQVAVARQARDAALAVIAEDRANAESGRAVIQQQVPADLYALYEKQRTRYGTGASHLRFGVSSATGVKLLENEMQAIRAADPDEVIMCATSEAILVRTSESGL